MTAKLQLSLGIDEEATDVKITRSKDGDTSIAVFIFDVPNCMTGENAANNEILGMYMIDEEGEMVTRNVNASTGRRLELKQSIKLKAIAIGSAF